MDLLKIMFYISLNRFKSKVSKYISLQRAQMKGREDTKAAGTIHVFFTAPMGSLATEQIFQVRNRTASD